MPIKDTLQEDWKNAVKARDRFKSQVLSMAKSSILLMEKTNGVRLEDEQIIEVLARDVKQRREALLEFQKGGRQDLVDKANAEIEILLSYLPQQLSEKEILEIVKEAADSVGADSIKDMGKVMSEVKSKVVGRADGKLVSTIVKNYLNNK